MGIVAKLRLTLGIAMKGQHLGSSQLPHRCIYGHHKSGHPLLAVGSSTRPSNQMTNQGNPEECAGFTD